MRDLTDVATPRRSGPRSSTRRRCSRAARSTARSTACRSTSTRGSGCGCRNKAFEDAGVPVPTNWDEFVAAAPKLREARQDPARHRRRALAGIGRLQRPDARARRQGPLQSRSSTTRTPRSPPGPRWRRSSKAADAGPRDGGKAATSRTGTRRPTSSSPTRPAARSWATGRRASSRSRARSPARTTPACPASATTRSSRHRRRRLLLPADRGRGESRRRRRSSPR